MEGSARVCVCVCVCAGVCVFVCVSFGMGVGMVGGYQDFDIYLATHK